MSKLPTWQEMFLNALEHLDTARNTISDVRDELASDWSPTGSTLPDDVSAARADARRTIGQLKSQIDELKNTLSSALDHHEGWETHPDPPESEDCDECGNAIPVVDGGGMQSSAHAESCSLHVPAGSAGEKPGPAPDEHAFAVDNGALTQAPVWDSHVPSKNWAATIDRNLCDPSLWNQTFWKVAPGDEHIYIVPTGITIGTAVEFGTDYGCNNGQGELKCWYGTVTSVSDTEIVFREHATLREAYDAGQGEFGRWKHLI